MLHCRRQFTYIFIKKVRALHIYKKTPSKKSYFYDGERTCMIYFYVVDRGEYFN